jgi:hypothetical protein
MRRVLVTGSPAAFASACREVDVAVQVVSVESRRIELDDLYGIDDNKIAFPCFSAGKDSSSSICCAERR